MQRSLAAVAVGVASAGSVAQTARRCTVRAGLSVRLATHLLCQTHLAVDDEPQVSTALNSWTTTRHFVATSFYSEEGGTLNTDTVYAGSFIDLCKRPVVISPVDSDDR